MVDRSSSRNNTEFNNPAHVCQHQIPSTGNKMRFSFEDLSLDRSQAVKFANVRSIGEDTVSANSKVNELVKCEFFRKTYPELA